MVEHLVLFKMKAEATTADEDTLLAALVGLTAIETVVELSCGRNFSPRSQGHALGLRVLCETRESLQTYLDHPLHQAALQEAILPVIESVTVVDYEA
jgi:hypothetical protein